MLVGGLSELWTEQSELCHPHYVVIVGRNEEKTNMKVTKTKDGHYRYHIFENECNIVNVS